MRGKGGGGVEELEEQLCLVDRSLNWLLVIVGAVLLSFAATVRQREALCLSLAGETEAAAAVGCVLPVRRLASVLIVLALTFFFLVSLSGADQAQQGGDPAQIRSACRNLWASLFVLAAALLRLLDAGERCALAEEKSCE